MVDRREAELRAHVRRLRMMREATPNAAREVRFRQQPGRGMTPPDGTFSLMCVTNLDDPADADMVAKCSTGTAFILATTHNSLDDNNIARHGYRHLCENVTANWSGDVEGSCIMCVNGGITVTLTNTPSGGTWALIYDKFGNAGGSPITVDTSGPTINGAASKTIATNYNGLYLIGNGAGNWNAFIWTGA